MLAGGIIIAALAAGLAVTLTGAGEISVPHRDITLSDVAILSGIGSETARGLVIARLPAAGGTRQLARSALLDLVRRSVPGAKIAGPTAGVLVIRSAAPEPRRLEAQDYAEPAPAVHRGEKLVLSSRAGAVRIERPVTAVQDASARAARVFVRTDDGQVFAAPLKSDSAR